MHIRLLELSEEGRPYLAVLYNLGLTAFFAVDLGLLMGKITDLVVHSKHITDVADNVDKAESAE